MKNTVYEAPLTETIEVRIEGGILINSVEHMNTVTGSWDEEDED